MSGPDLAFSGTFYESTFIPKYKEIFNDFGVELPQVMLEMQKANVSFRALTEVRNKFVDAYREIMNMPL